MKVIVNEILLNHIESGHPHGVPVVFIHGFPFNHSMWDQQINHLPNDYRLITYDIRGMGTSDLGNGEVSIEKHADDLIGLLDDLQIEQAIVVGLSMGGYIALKALDKYPKRFLGAVLCDTKSENDTEEARQKRYEAIKQIEVEGTHTFAKEFIKKVVSPKTYEENLALVGALENMVAENPVSGLVASQRAMATREDTTSSLKKIKVPTLIMVGEDDQLTPPQVAESIRDKVSNAYLEVIPRAGHLSNLENPEVFNEKLINFLKNFNKMPE